jgi:hypothetical protein
MRYNEKNKDKSAASFCRQVAAWSPNIFLKHLFVKNYSLTTPEVILKTSTDLDSLKF